MPAQTVELTDHLNRFVSEKVSSGRFENPSGVVTAALQSTERQERIHDEKLTALRAAVDGGLASGIAEGDIFEEIFAELDQLDATDKL